MLKLKAYRIDKDLPLPQYATAGSVGFDLLTRQEITIKPQTIALVPTNLILELPPGFVLLVTARSSTPRRKKLSVPHGVGIIDQDFCGPQDEIQIQVYNFSTQTVKVERGEKIAQALVTPCARVQFTEVPAITRATRGGFGSTDT